jgi:hypothetical protein
MTDSLQPLLETPIERRDVEWENKFLSSFPEAKITLLFQDPKPGPDQWPYLFVQTGGAENARDVLGWLSSRGIGLAVNPQKNTPDFVLTYGMIWNFRETGKFLSDAPPRTPGTFELKPGQQVLTGPPSETFLPKYVRAILKQFLLDQGVYAPKVLMVSVDPKADQKNYDLCFSLEGLGNPPESEHKGLAEALSWFLPAHYSIALISEKLLPGFESL